MALKTVDPVGTALKIVHITDLNNYIISSDSSAKIVIVDRPCDSESSRHVMLFLISIES